MPMAHIEHPHHTLHPSPCIEAPTCCSVGSLHTLCMALSSFVSAPLVLAFLCSSSTASARAARRPCSCGCTGAQGQGTGIKGQEVEGCWWSGAGVKCFGEGKPRVRGSKQVPC